MNELTSLQQLLSTNDTATDISSNIINQLLGWTLIPSLIFLGLFLLLYVIRSIHRHKVDKAIFEIRDMLRESRATNPAPSNDKSEPELK